MPTQSESPAAVSGTSQKMLQLLRKRLRQLVRVMLVVTICLAVASGALAIWWLNSLSGLPDIGDRFDVEAFRSFSLPDDRNARPLAGCQATREWRHGGRLGLLSLGPSYDNSRQPAQDDASGSRQRLVRMAAATAGDVGGRSGDDDSPAQERVEGSAQDRAKA